MVFDVRILSGMDWAAVVARGSLSAALDGCFGPSAASFWGWVSFLTARAVGCYALSAIQRSTLWVMAISSKTQRALSSPRTRNCCRPRSRASAFTHSAVAARCL